MTVNVRCLMQQLEDNEIGKTDYYYSIRR